VYRGRDTKLEREVAYQVLPPIGAGRRIAQIYGVEDSQGVRALADRDLKPANIMVTPDGAIEYSTSVWRRRTIHQFAHDCSPVCAGQAFRSSPPVPELIRFRI